MSRIFDDARQKPELFRWNGPLDADAIDRWIARMRWRIPLDLRSLWVVTGGGELFESETLLRPLEFDDTSEITRVTEWWRARGLAEQLVVFHEGMGLSAIRQSDGYYVWVPFTEPIRPACAFQHLDEWYEKLIRAEYASRYGM
jgi:hypothetical protein